MRVLVFGGRAYDDAEAIARSLDRFHKERGITVLIHGGAGKADQDGFVLAGADRLAGQWALDQGITVWPFPVLTEEWRILGKKAGMLRNRRMIDLAMPQYGIGFPGGPGTADMLDQLKKAGIVVWQPKV